MALNARALAAVMFAGLLAGPPGARADYPERPVQLMVAFSAGGGTDLASRMLARGLSDLWKQSVVVDNRPGGDGVLAASLLAKGRADGYTFLITTNAHTITPSLTAVPYHPINDFSPISLIAYTDNQILVVHPSVPARSVRQLIALAKAKPGALNFGSSGAGTTPYLGMELLKQVAGIDIVHVPYKGGATTSAALRQGEIEMMFGTPAGTYPHVKAGAIRPLAITSTKRWAMLPDVPTMVESGFPDFVIPVWYGALAHPKTPAQIVSKLHADITKVVKSSSYAEKLQTQGYDAVTNTPDEFRTMISAELERWNKVIKNIKKVQR